MGYEIHFSNPKEYECTITFSEYSTPVDGRVIRFHPSDNNYPLMVVLLPNLLLREYNMERYRPRCYQMMGRRESKM